MSRVLASFPDAPPKRRVLPCYNWALWFDGRVHALSADEYRDVYVFRNAAHSMAARYGLRVRTTVIDRELILQAEETGEIPDRSFRRLAVGQQ